MLVVLHSPIPHEVAPLQSSTMLQTAEQRYELKHKLPSKMLLMSACNLSYWIPTTQNQPAIWAIRRFLHGFVPAAIVCCWRWAGLLAFGRKRAWYWCLPAPQFPTSAVRTTFQYLRAWRQRGDSDYRLFCLRWNFCTSKHHIPLWSIRTWSRRETFPCWTWRLFSGSLSRPCIVRPSRSRDSTVILEAYRKYLKRRKV